MPPGLRPISWNRSSRYGFLQNTKKKGNLTPDQMRTRVGSESEDY
jgi:hypothetical protein